MAISLGSGTFNDADSVCLSSLFSSPLQCAGAGHRHCHHHYRAGGDSGGGGAVVVQIQVSVEYQNEDVV